MEDKKQSKRPYKAPRIEKLGDFGTLTQGPFGGSIDQIAGADGGFQLGS